MVPNRRVRRKQIIRELPNQPKRPKRALSGYNLFVRENRNIPEINPALNLVQQLSVRWRALSDQERQGFNDRVGEDRARHQNQVAEWKRQQHALKRPPFAFGIFLRELWHTEGNNGRTIVQMNRYASERWRDMTYDKRRRYHDAYRRMIARHRQVIRQVRLGGGLQYGWKEEMYPAPLRAQQQQQIPH